MTNLPIESIIEKYFNRMIVDEETGYIYGFGFDQYIEELKKNKKKGEGSFEDEINAIFMKLGYFNKEELLFLHRYIISEAKAAEFEKKARLYLADSILGEVLQAKNRRSPNKKIISIIKKEEWDSLLVIDAKDKKALFEKLNKLEIDETIKKNVAAYFAKEQVIKSLEAKALCNL